MSEFNMPNAEARIVRSNPETRWLSSGQTLAEVDSEVADELFDTGELNIITDVEVRLGAEAGRIAGDILLELKKVEQRA